MNIGEIFRNSWGLTWRLWQLWVLMFLLLVVFTPAVVLAGGFGGMAGALLVPLPGRTPAWLAQLRNIPAWVWLITAVGVLGVLVVTTALSWILQAASMRGAALAMEKGSFTLGEALNLGRQRFVSLLKISLTFGALIGALGILPPLIVILLADKFTFGLQLLQTFQAVLEPVNIVLGIVILLVMMSVALEDLTPRRAFRRAWGIFRLGWWGFLLVFGISFVPAFVLVLSLLPVIFLLLLVFIASPTLAPLLALATGVFCSPILLILILFISVFTLILYTLTYRAAAQLLGPEAA